MSSNYPYLLPIVFIDILLFAICLMNWVGKIHFGLGIADFLVVVVIVLLLLVLNGFYFFSKSEGSFFYNKQIFLLTGLGLLLIGTIIKMTLLRGDASPWNGKIFF